MGVGDWLMDQLDKALPENIRYDPSTGKDQLDWCFAGETEYLTFDGPRTFKETVGSYQRVLDGNGLWVESEIRSFGVQPLVRLTLRKHRGRKVIYVTANHRWIVKGGERRETQELQPGDRLAHRLPWSQRSLWSPNPFGIAHGFVYGDGTLSGGVSEQGRGRPAKVALWGAKDAEMVRYFAGCDIVPRQGHRANQDVDGVEVRNLPRFFKERPSLDEAPSYLLGWLAGYFAADGRVSAGGGNITLYSSCREDLEFVQAVCARLTIATYDIRSYERASCASRGRIHDDRVATYGECSWCDGTRTAMFELNFVSTTLSEEFFLLSEHRARFVAARERGAKPSLTWTVDSIEETDRVEEVFCAVVPTTESFVLQSNILTGNCRFRRDQHCWYAKTLDAEGTAQAGYAVWTPEDRGVCPRADWVLQRQCPIGEPGPESADPYARVDATIPWSQGGQRGGRPGEPEAMMPWRQRRSES